MSYEIRWDSDYYNDNNDNIHAGAKFDAGGGAETSFLLTVALNTTTNFQFLYYFIKVTSHSQLKEIKLYSKANTNIKHTKGGNDISSVNLIYHNLSQCSVPELMHYQNLMIRIQSSHFKQRFVK